MLRATASWCCPSRQRPAGSLSADSPLSSCPCSRIEPARRTAQQAVLSRRVPVQVGTLPADNPVSWRASSLTYEASAQYGFADLTGGWLTGGAVGNIKMTQPTGVYPAWPQHCQLQCLSAAPAV